MGSKKLFSWLLVLVLMLVTAAGCETSELTAVELIPQDANLIANIQVSKIVNDQDLREAYDKAKKKPGQPQTAEEALNEAVEETGIDFRDFSEVIIFGNVTRWTQEEYLGVIVEGTFDEKQFIDNIGEKTGKEFTTSDYKGYKLYIDQLDKFGVVFLSDRMLLFGAVEAVKDAIDVSKGDKRPASGIIFDTYNRLGDALIKFAFEVPEEVQETLAEESIPGEIPISMESFANIDILGFVFDKKADTITVQITPHFLSTESAEDARDMLSGVISLFKGTLQVPEIKELLGKIEVSVTDSWMTIAFEITLSEIERLTETFQP